MKKLQSVYIHNYILYIYLCINIYIYFFAEYVCVYIYIFVLQKFHVDLIEHGFIVLFLFAKWSYHIYDQICFHIYIYIHMFKLYYCYRGNIRMYINIYFRDKCSIFRSCRISFAIVNIAVHGITFAINIYYASALVNYT